MTSLSALEELGRGIKEDWFVYIKRRHVARDEEVLVGVSSAVECRDRGQSMIRGRRTFLSARVKLTYDSISRYGSNPKSLPPKAALWPFGNASLERHSKRTFNPSCLATALPQHWPLEWQLYCAFNFFHLCNSVWSITQAVGCLGCRRVLYANRKVEQSKGRSPNA